MSLHARLLLLAIASAFAASSGYAQSISGSTTITVDATTLMVTATCETDLDGYSWGVYNPSVACTLKDGAGTTLAMDSHLDVEDESSAQVILEFQGTAGTAYVATGKHYAWMAIQAYDPDLEGTGPPSAFLYHWDAYNFSSYIENGPPDPYPYFNNFYWFGPGPEVYTKAPKLTFGPTSAGDCTAPPSPSHSRP